MPKKPFIGSGRVQEGGYGATHKRDFLSHTEGGGFKHDADHINMNPPLPQLSHPNVQGTLELLGSFSVSQGSGFISIGNSTIDGYAVGSYNVSESTSLYDAFQLAFADERLKNGGVILLLAGTYRLNNTVLVPPGINIMGEKSGTIIIGETPNVSMFRFENGVNFPKIGGDSGSGPLSLNIGSPIDASGLVDIILADNLDGYVTSGGQPVATMTSVPMVSVETSSNVSIINTKFIGRVNNGTVNNRLKTLRAIGTIPGAGTGTHLVIDGCYFDGMKTGILFEPLSGNLDHLIIKNCKARCFGAEDGGFSIEENCFVGMSLCNFSAKNNYFVGFGTFPTQSVFGCFVVTTLGGGNPDVSITISGTYGGPSSGAEAMKTVFFDTTFSNIKSVISNNNWGSNLDNQWFITVGDGYSVGNGTFGDFVGPGAIDLILSIGPNSIGYYPVTVIVNKGTYNITSSGKTEGVYNFIGNSSDSDLPVFNLNSSSSINNDELGNKLFNCGRYIKSIKFQSDVSSGNFHSVRPGGFFGGQRFLNIEDCIFENVSLSINDSTGSESSGIVVKNCKFEQTGDFDDNVCFLLPSLNTVELISCQISGYGYAGLIGDDSGLGYNTSPGLGNIIIKNCFFNQTGASIDDSTPFSENGYLIINNIESSVLIENTKIVANTSYGSVSTINTNLTTARGFDNYIFIKADHISIKDSLFHGPDQFYVNQSDSLDYSMIGVKLLPIKSLKVSESSFLYGGTSCQIGTSTDVLSGNDVELIMLNNNTFAARAGSISNTALDIDLNPSVITSHPKILISGNKFNVSSRESGQAPNYPLHSVSGSNYNAHGIVQIYVNNIPVIFNNNFINGDLNSILPTGFEHVSGLVIDTTRPSGVARLAPIDVKNNQIEVANLFTSSTSSESASTTFIVGSTLSLSNNLFRMINTAALDASTITCLYVSNTQVGGNDPEKAIVTNNIFSRRRNSSGTPQNLVSGFIRIPASSEAGVIFNNIFSDNTIDGTIEDLISDDSGNWSSYNNINEYYSIVTRGELGTAGLQNNTIGEDVYSFAAGAGLGANIGSIIQIDPTSSSNPMVFGYQDHGGPTNVDFKWIIPLKSILPIGATVVEVSVDVDVTSNPSVSISRLRVVGSSGTDQDLQNSLTTSGHTHLLSGLNQKIESGIYSYVELYASITNASSLNYLISPLSIKYLL